MGVNSLPVCLPKTVTQESRACDLIPRPSALESSTLTTRLQSGAAREAVYCRRPGLPGRRTHVEQPTGQRDISPVSVNFPSASTNISVPGLIPRHYH